MDLNIVAPEKARFFAGLCRVNALYMIMQAGSGHIGSSFSCLDIVSWLYLNEIKDGQAVYFSSKGHDAPGLYAVLTGLGIIDFETLHRLRRLGGLTGHPDVQTPGIEANTGSLGMGISKAKGMVRANRLKGQPRPVYVLTGDGELQEGQIWESLATAANDGLDEITVIVDHNKIQSDTWVTRVSDLGNLEQKFKAFGWRTARVDGHDLRAFSKTLSQLRRKKGKPQVIIADTLKGKGVSFMENGAFGPEGRLYPYHSGAPDLETYSRALSELESGINDDFKSANAPLLELKTISRIERHLPGTHRLVRAYSEALVEEGQQCPNLVVLDADLALDCGLIPFEKKFPERFIECGIAEQDMVSQAGGLALKGFLPVVHSFASFLSARANEQIYNNATEKTKMIYVASLAGLLPGEPGHSHQSVRDISAVGSVPNLTLIQPGSEEEARLAFRWAVHTNAESTYLRLASIPFDAPFKLSPEDEIKKGIGTVLAEGADAVLFAYGPVMLSEAFHASALLRSRNIGLKVVNLPWLNTVDGDWLDRTVQNYKVVFTLDDHYVIGGQGAMIAAKIAQRQLPAKVLSFGVQKIPVCGKSAEVLQAHGLDSESLAQRILSELQ